MQNKNSGRRSFFFSILIISVLVFVGGGLLGMFKEGGGFVFLPLLVIFAPLLLISGVLTLMGEVSNKGDVGNQDNDAGSNNKPVSKFLKYFLWLLIVAVVAIFLLFFTA